MCIPQKRNTHHIVYSHMFDEPSHRITRFAHRKDVPFNLRNLRNARDIGTTSITSTTATTTTTTTTARIQICIIKIVIICILHRS